MKETLYDKLDKLKLSDEYAFHMPGHKRNEDEGPFAEVMKMDITEIDGFDNLHHPEEIIKEEQEFAAKLYGAKKTFFLVNGSTAGILAAICGTTSDSENIVFSRNAHKSAYHALYLKDLSAYYIYPQQGKEKKYIQGRILPEDVEKQMERSGAKVVFVTSPTYEGIVSDISSIAEVVHKRNGILIVDEAHGAHFGFHSYFPKSAIGQGADIVIQSLHKTLPSLTQTALLHICSNRINEQEVARWLSIFQTSSPSYVLMASMSRCLHEISEKAEIYFSQYRQKLDSFYECTRGLTCLSVMHPTDAQKFFQAQTDPSKIVICAENLVDEKGKNFGGKQLGEILLKTYGLQMEMISEKYVLAMTSIYDSQEGFRRLTQALKEIDKTLKRKDLLESTKELADTGTGDGVKAQAFMTIKQALNGNKEKKKWADCVESISAEYVYLYPPGSPILVPGEKITSQIQKEIDNYKKQGLNVLGPADDNWEQFTIVKKGNNIQK